MTCYLVRHGTAASGPDDRTRPLTTQGRAEVEATARALAARRAGVAEIRHSGLSRARESAEILGETLRPPRGVHATTGLVPQDDPDIARAELELAAEPLMLVGHLPHLARLAGSLVGGVEVEGLRFAPGTAVALRRDAGGWTLEAVISPRAGDAP
jgi:phosphohistidine phosphatase